MIPRRRVSRMTYSDLPLFAGLGYAAAAAAQPDRFAAAVGVEDYDITERRSGAQGGSPAANRAVRPTKQQQRDAVLAAVLRAGEDGLTLRELAARWEMPMHAISGRFSELKAMGLICRHLWEDGKPLLREGCGVWIDARLACRDQRREETWR